MISSRSHERVPNDSSKGDSPIYEVVKINYQKGLKHSNKYCLPPFSQTTFPSSTNLRPSINGLQIGNRSDSRKSVRFSEQIGCRRIPCVESQESFVEKVPGKIKPMRNFYSPVTVFDEAPPNQSQGLFCLPKIHRRLRSVSPIETAVWNSGRQLRQYVPSPNLFHRLPDLASGFLRSHGSSIYNKWRSQPSLKSTFQKNTTPVTMTPEFGIDRMESVYVSDSEEEYEWGIPLSEWEGYENPSALFASGTKVEYFQGYALTNSDKSDEDLGFGEYEPLDPDPFHILKAQKSIQCRFVEDSKANFKSPYERAQCPGIFSEKTALQNRVEQSLNRLNLPEWMQKKVDGVTESKPSKLSHRLPRFPRYVNSSLVNVVADTSKVSPFRIRRWT